MGAGVGNIGVKAPITGIDLGPKEDENGFLVKPRGRPDRPDIRSPYQMQESGKFDDYGRPIMTPKTDEQGNPLMQSDLAWQDYEKMEWDKSAYEAGPWEDISSERVSDDMSWMDKRAADTMFQRGTEAGPSQWAKLAEQKQRAEELQAREDISADMAGQLAGARSQLAMRGGLGSGARERLATSGQRGLNAERQRLARQGQLSRMGLGMEDQSRKDRMLGQAAQAQLGYSGLEGGIRQSDAQRAQAAALANQQGAQQVSQFNVSQRLGFDVGQTDRQRQAQERGLGYKQQSQAQYNKQLMDLYGEEMAEWGADRTANEIRRA